MKLICDYFMLKIIALYYLTLFIANIRRHIYKDILKIHLLLKSPAFNVKENTSNKPVYINNQKLKLTAISSQNTLYIKRN